MYRTLTNKLVEWKNKKNHKPLILEGARQVGKTWLMKEFGKKYFEQVAYINFDLNDNLKNIFSENLDIKRLLMAIELEVGYKIEASNTLIIFDEIQECPRAITSLKYFNEEMPQLYIVAAGSLLGLAHHSGTGFPVGKVEFLKLYPLSFFEFLEANKKQQFIDLIINHEFSMIKHFKLQLEDLLKQYCFIGGMPEVVQDYIENKDFISVRQIQQNILSAYEKDFTKHIPENTAERARMLWNSIPTQLAKENKKFIYNAVKKSSRAKDFEIALTWLKDTGLVYKIHKIKKPGLPIGSYEDLDSFKLYILDVGLLGALVKLDARTILGKYDIYQEFKGAITEQYVLQELISQGNLPVFYWANETSRAEIDFLIEHESKIIPIEVKATTNLKAKSLKSYIEKYNPDIAIRTSLSDYKQTDIIHDLPLYAINEINKI